MPQAGPPLEADCDLRLIDPSGRQFTIAARGGRGRVSLPRSALSLRTLNQLPEREARRLWAVEVERALGLCGLALDVACAGRIVARVIPGRPGNWVARLLRLGPVQVRVGGVLAALLFPRSQ